MRGVLAADAVAAVAIAVLLLLSTGLGAGAPPRAEPRSESPAEGRGGPAPDALSANWTNLSLTSAEQPPPRDDANMVYDPTGGYVLLFGGQYLNETTFRTVVYNDTWTFSGGEWRNATPAVSPSPRQGAGLAFDPATNEILLFGGRSASGALLNDTWEWSSGTWKNLTPFLAGPSPPPGYWFSMAYDAQTGAVLLFGGINETDGITDYYTNATWSFLGDQWSQLTPADSPPARHAQEMFWDSVDDEMVLFGGLGSTVYLNDTWTFSDGNWSPVTTSPTPGARAGLGITYDIDIDRVVLFGGSPAPDDFYSTWLFHAGAWLQYNTTIAPDNPQATYGQFVYDGEDLEIVDLNEPDGAGPVSTWVLTFQTTIGPSTYPVTFHETGLPAATEWQVGLAGATNVSTTASIGFTEPNGQYSFTVPSTLGFNASPRSGSVLVNAAALTENITFSSGPVPFTVELQANPATISLGNATNFTTATTGGTSPFVYAYTNLPAGCASADRATLPCVPTAANSYRVTVTVTDADGHVAQANASLTVTSPGSGTPSGAGSDGWWVLAVVAVAAVVLAVLFWRRRRPPAPSGTAAPAPPPPAPPGPPPSR